VTAAGAAARPGAFFDVDGTLTRAATIFSFLRFWMQSAGLPASAYQQARQRLADLTAAGLPRSVTNRAYFASYAGREVSWIAEQARSWFRAELDQGGLFRPEGLDAFRRHAASGHLTALVSASFPECLAPLALHLGARHVLCSRPQVQGGRYTGQLDVPMVGARKAEAVRALAAARHISLAGSWAYGDHASDMPLLKLVGHPVVVGDDPCLLGLARQRGWPVSPQPQSGSQAPG
jgi:HAD superfamily hydrolase (TIGR01490 family)